MTANELADELVEISLIADNHTKMVLGIAEEMLRQQHAEINTLRNHGYRTQYELIRLEFIQFQTEVDALKKTIESLFVGLESSLELNKAILKRAQER